MTAKKPTAQTALLILFGDDIFLACMCVLEDIRFRPMVLGFFQNQCSRQICCESRFCRSLAGVVLDDAVAATLVLLVLLVLLPLEEVRRRVNGGAVLTVVVFADDALVSSSSRAVKPSVVSSIAGASSAVVVVLLKLLETEDKALVARSLSKRLRVGMVGAPPLPSQVAGEGGNY